MLLTVSSFGESFRRTTKFGGSIFNPMLKRMYAAGLHHQNYFLPTAAGSESMGRTIKNELPFPSTDSTQMRP